MEPASRVAMDLMQQFKKSEVELNDHPNGRYPKDFTGLGKCHLRALWNISKKSAMEASDIKIRYKDSIAVKSLSKDFEGRVMQGVVFFIHQQHWVSLRRLGETNEAVYYDDKVMMKLNNYEGAAKVSAKAQEKPKKKINDKDE